MNGMAKVAKNIDSYGSVNIDKVKTIQLGDRIPLAHSLRGLAALWVVLFHVQEGNHIESLLNVMPEFVSASIFGAGHFGVPIFFVLSGLVIARSGAVAGASLKALLGFLYHRLIRLSPPYFVSIGVVLMALLFKAWVLHKDVAFPTVFELLSHLLYVQDIVGANTILPVYWTLAIEVQFYIVYGMVMLISHSLQNRYSFARVEESIIIGACVFAVMWPLGIIETSVYPGSFLTTWYLFLMGVLTYKVMNGQKWANGMYIVYVGVLGGIGVMNHDGFTIAGVLSSLILLLAVQRRHSFEWTGMWGLSYLGLISYSLYLLHSPVTGTTYAVVRKVFGYGLFADVLGLFATLVASIAVAWIGYVLVERPSMQFSSRKRR